MENHVERKVFYYELDFQYLKDVNPDERSYVEIINEIRAMCNNQAEERFFARRQFNMSTNSSEEKKLVDDNKIGVFEFKNFSRVGSLCAFKFIRIRKDVFPELIQDNDLNKLEDIDGAGKSVVESTHIILDYSDPLKLRIAIEYNIEGPKFLDFVYYLKKVGGKLNLVKSIKYIILTNDNLERLSNSMGDCKFVEVRVLRENIERVKKHDAKLGSILEELGGFFNSNYYTLRLRLDYEHHNADNQGIIRKFVKIFASKKEELSAYEKFSVEAVNTSKEERKFEAFDLLVDKVKSIITVQRKLNSKVINTSEMFSLMVDEYTNKIA